MGDQQARQRVDWPERHKNTTDERHTPVRLVRQLKDAIGGDFDLDPCGGCEPTPIARTRYTVGDDGLQQPWFGRVFVNPPYSEIAAWMDNLTSELARPGGPDLIVALIPVRPSTDWFHEHATQADWLGLFDGRLRFGDTDGSAPFPSGLLAYGRDGQASIPDGLRALMAARGAVYTLDETTGPTTAKTTLDDLLGEPATPPEFASVVEVPALGVGDPVTVTFESDALGFPTGVPQAPTAVVLDITPQGNYYTILLVSDEPPAGSEALETYIAIRQRRTDPRDVEAVVCEHGNRRWRHVTLREIALVEARR